MKKTYNLKTLVLASLLVAFTCISTMILQVPTPTFGYIHLGDTLVILCGILLGPVLGGFSAGLGSMFADILSGYVIFAIPTLIIKGLSAFLAGFAFLKLKKKFATHYPAFFIAALLSEINVVFGYFINEVVRTLLLNTSATTQSLSAGIISGLGGVPLNILQGVVGILLSFSLFPLLLKVYSSSTSPIS